MDVRRKGGKNVFPKVEDETFDWEQSFFLNVILMCFDYTIEVSIREKYLDPTTQKERLKVIKKVVKKVYATPHKVRLDDDEFKSENVPEMTYPYVYFAVSDFDCAWKDISLYRDNQVICVELFGSGDLYSKEQQKNHKRLRLFAGALSFEVIKSQYRNRKFQFNFASTQFFKLLVIIYCLFSSFYFLFFLLLLIKIESKKLFCHKKRDQLGKDLLKWL